MPGFHNHDLFFRLPGLAKSAGGFLPAMVIVLLGYLSPAFGNANLTVDLNRLIDEANRTSLIPVIIKFKDRVDIPSLRAKASQRLQYAQSDFTSRKRLQQLLRKSIVAELKERAWKPQQALSRLLRLNGVNTPLKSLWNINAVALKLPARLVDEVAALPGIERITVDMQLTMSTSPTQPVSAEPLWNLNNVNTNYLWQLGYTGDGVMVAIMDSGVDLNHPDLVGRWRGGGNSWFDPYGQNDLPIDLNGHGTQALSLILGGDASGYQVGMAPHAQWIAARLFDDADHASLSAIHEAFQWLLDPDGDPTTDDAPDVVNNSWGFSSTINQCYQEFSDDIRMLREAGIAVVFSAGNYGPYDETSISPGNDPGVLSVGSVDHFNAIDSFSSRGPGACDGGVFPKLVAPGSLIYTADRLPIGYNVVSGTSFSAPHVTGAIVLLKSAFPMATVTQIESALRDSATDLGNRGADDQFGYGMLNVAAAYDLLYKDLGSSSAGMLSFSESLYSVDETTAKLIVNVRRLGGSAGEITVDYTTLDGQAGSARPADFTATSGTLRFADGETVRSFEIPIINDQLDEQNETFYVSLSNPSGDAILSSSPQVPVTILDDDGPGEVSFGAVSYAVNESHGSASVSLIRTGGFSGTISADITLTDASARLDSDFLLPDQTTLEFSDGEVSKQLTIPVIDDEVHEDNETFKVSLTGSSGGGIIGSPASTTVTILDDDPDTSITTLHLDAVNYYVQESAGKITINVVRSGNSDRMASVEYATADGSAKAGKDYKAVKGRLVFRPRVIRKPIDIDIYDDGIYERESSFTLVLTSADGGSQLAKPSAAIIRIGNNDAQPGLSLGTSGNKTSLSRISGNISSSRFDTQSNGNNRTTDNSDNRTNSSLKIFDLSLRGYSGVGDEDLKRQQTLGGRLDIPEDGAAEKHEESSEPDSKAACDGDTPTEECADEKNPLKDQEKPGKTQAASSRQLIPKRKTKDDAVSSSMQKQHTE